LLLALRLSTGQFLVNHCGSLHHVCLVGIDGAVVHSYGGPKGSQLTQMNEPSSLSVDREGHVLVADQCNNKLLVIDQSLSSAHEMSVSVDTALLPDTSTTNLFSAIKETEPSYIMRQQRKATREAMRLNELVAYAVTKSYKSIMDTYIHITRKRN